MIDTRRHPEPSWIGGPPDSDYREEPWEYLPRCHCGRWLKQSPDRTEYWENTTWCDGIVVDGISACGYMSLQHTPHRQIEWAGTTGIWQCSNGHEHRDEL